MKFKKDNLLNSMMLILGTTLSFSAFASIQNSFDGFYTGVAAGESITSGRHFAHRQASLSIPSLGVSLQGDYHAKQFSKRSRGTGELFTGFGRNCDPIYLGIEAYAKAHKSKSTLKDRLALNTTFLNTFNEINVITKTQTKLKEGEYGADLRPGFLLTSDSLIYGRIGAAINKISLRSETLFINQNQLIDAPFIKAREKNITALRVGGGLEQQFCANWAIRADYTFTNYRKISAQGEQVRSFFNPLGLRTIGTFFSSDQAKLNNHTFTLGLSYYW